MTQKRKRLSGPEKITIVKRYLVERVPISYGPHLILARLCLVFLSCALCLSFGAPKPATHRRAKPAAKWGVLDRRILLFGPVGKGCDQFGVV
jgi:hypothetical protein